MFNVQSDYFSRRLIKNDNEFVFNFVRLFSIKTLKEIVARI